MLLLYGGRAYCGVGHGQSSSPSFCGSSHSVCLLYVRLRTLSDRSMIVGMFVAERVICVAYLDGLRDTTYTVWGLDMQLAIVIYGLSFVTNGVATAMITWQAR
jgi:hypothetical protein